VPHLRDDRQQDRALDDRLPDRAGPGARERLAKALESLGVNWGATLPIPKTSAERFPEVKKLLDQGLQSLQYTFSADDKSEAAKLFRGASPSGDGTELTTAVMPEGSPMTMAPERREEFSPGLDPELLALIQATAEVEISAAGKPSS